MSRNVLVVELNEFNAPLLKKACTQFDLPALSHVLEFTHTEYRSPDRYHSGYLEPWVQWVSIHAGTPSSEHQIKHLGDVPDLVFEQCWETLTQHDITTGVWGVMNGNRRNSDKTSFFLPDPWTFSEQAFPQELNNLLDLPRYVAKNYQNLKKTYLVKKAFHLLKFIFSSNTATKISLEVFHLLFNLCRYGKKHFVYISFFDYISTLLFIEYKKKHNPQCAFIFLNSLAHLQHHHWRESSDTITPEILYGLKYIDRIFSLLLTNFPDDAFVVHNGLSQMNTNHERPWILYRQKDPMHFLKALGIPALKVEQHMTHDGHVFFDTATACEEAFLALHSATLNQQPLFHVERNTQDDQKLFYQLKFTDKLDKKADPTFEFSGKSYPFFQHFDKIVTRTGRHIPIGNIFSKGIKFRQFIYNHEFNQYLYHALLPELYPYPETTLEFSISAEAFLSEEV
jgi:hypothetical protein